MRTNIIKTVGILTAAILALGIGAAGKATTDAGHSARHALANDQGPAASTK
jgi:hypothetical protein